MSVNPIKGKFVRLQNDEMLKARNQADSAEVEILKVNTGDQVELASLPVFDDGTDVSQVATEKYVDGEIATVDGRIDSHVNGTAEKHGADDIVVAPAGALTSINVQLALEEIQTDASQGISDAATAQAAAAAAQEDISHLVTLSGMPVDSDNLGSFTGTFIPDGATVKSALQTLETLTEAINTAGSNHINATVDAHDASAISVAPGIANLAAVNVQTALAELQADTDSRVKKAGDTMSGLLDITVAGVGLEVNDLIIGEPWGAGFSVISVKDGVGDELYVQSADRLGPSFKGNASKQVVISSGYSEEANSGPIQILTGDAFTSGNSGQVNIRSGGAVSGASGAIQIGSGGVTSGNTGAVNVASSGNASLGTTGSAQIQSGVISNAASSSDTGFSQIRSGDNAGAGQSGNVFVASGNNTGTGDSGNIQLYAGSVVSGVRGHIELSGSSVNLFSKIDMNSNQINELANGTLSSDAINKGQLDTGLALKVDLAGDEMTGFLTLHSDPSAPFHAATKKYVDAVAEGLHVHAPARLLANFDLDGIYNDGPDPLNPGVGAYLDISGSPIAGIDGISLFNVGNRIIVAFQNASAMDPENGIYYIAAAGDINGSGDIVKLTRADDFNTPGEMAGGDFVFVQEGTTYGDTGWVMTETVVTVGTTPVKFLQFSGAGAYSAGDALLLTGTEFDVLFDNSSIGINGFNKLYIKDDGVGTSQIADSAVTSAQIDASVAGDAMEKDLSTGKLDVRTDGVSIGINPSNNLHIPLSGVGTNELAADSVTSDKIAELAVTSAQIDASVAGDAMEKDLSTGKLDVRTDGISIGINPSNNLFIPLSGVGTNELAADSVTSDKIAELAVTSAQIDASVAGDAMEKDLSTGKLDVRTDGISIGINPSNNLFIPLSGVGTNELAADSVTSDKIAELAVTSAQIDASVAGDAMEKDLSTGKLDVRTDGISIGVNPFNNLYIPLSGVGTNELAADSVTSDKIAELAVTSAQIDASVAGNAMEKDLSTGKLDVRTDGATIGINPSNNLYIPLLGVGTGELANDSVTSDKIAELAVTSAQIDASVAGDGLEKDLISGKLDIKKEFNLVPDISVSVSGLSIVNRWHKESYLIPGTVSSGVNDTMVLAHEPEPGSMSAFVDRLAIHEGEDYSISGSTVTFIGALAISGQQQLTSGDTIFFKYQKKAS